MSTSTTVRQATPRRVPRWAHASASVLLGLAFVLRLALLPVPLTLGLVLFLVVAGLFVVVSLTMQIRCWGTLLAPALTPARIVVSVFSVALVPLLANFPTEVALPWRIAVTILLPVTLYALLRWDDARTVELLGDRARREDRRRSTSPTATASTV